MNVHVYFIFSKSIIMVNGSRVKMRRRKVPAERPGPRTSGGVLSVMGTEVTLGVHVCSSHCWEPACDGAREEPDAQRRNKNITPLFSAHNIVGENGQIYTHIHTCVCVCVYIRVCMCMS